MAVWHPATFDGTLYFARMAATSGTSVAVTLKPAARRCSTHFAQQPQDADLYTWTEGSAEGTLVWYWAVVDVNDTRVNSNAPVTTRMVPP